MHAIYIHWNFYNFSFQQRGALQRNGLSVFPFLCAAPIRLCVFAHFLAETKRKTNVKKAQLFLILCQKAHTANICMTCDMFMLCTVRIVDLPI